MAGLTLTSWPPRRPEAVRELVLAALGGDMPGILPWAELAAEELLTNIFRYAYPEKHGTAVLDCRRMTLEGKDCLRLRVTDWGTSFDPFTEAPVPDVAGEIRSRPVGGLGVHLVKAVVWRRRYTRRGNANVVELFFTSSEER